MIYAKQQQQRVDQTKYDCFGILETNMILSIFKDLSVMTDVTVKMRGKTQKGGQRVEDCEEDNLKGSSKNQVW